VRESLPPRGYANQVALATSIFNTSSYFEEAIHDALMEECDSDFSFPRASG
jgi:hypothetical protein